jgi:hypothetical protein
MASRIAKLAQVLRHPTAHPTRDTAIDAELLFALYRPAGAKIDLCQTVIDGVQYTTDRSVMIRTDRLSGLDDDCWWASIGQWTPGRLASYAAALRGDLAPTATKTRFDPRLIFTLYMSGAGIRALAGEHTRNAHAVVIGTERVGLAFPLTAASAESLLGCVPGVPPMPGSVCTLEDAR